MGVKKVKEDVLPKAVKAKKVARPVEAGVVEIVDAPVEVARTLETLDGQPVVTVTELPNGRVQVYTANGVGYTLPKTEYDSLLA